MQFPTLKQAVPILFSVAITSACLFGSYGRLSWSNAWVLVSLNAAAGVVSSAAIARHGDLLAERSNIKAGKSWDKPIVFVVVLLGPVSTWITAGLNTRFHWSSTMPTAAFVAGVVLAVGAASFIAWAMYANRFFSSVVRIQKDRAHVVVTHGPYRIVRHPGYTGILVFTLATPLILNSRWAFVPALITAAATVLRTALEDRTLHKELPGYPEYASNVTCRLVPPLW